jgi:hypothetical protein
MKTYVHFSMCPLLVSIIETDCILYELRAETEERVEHRASNRIDCKHRVLTFSVIACKYPPLRHIDGNLL